jgi:hypothetical protein
LIALSTAFGSRPDEELRCGVLPNRPVAAVPGLQSGVHPGWITANPTIAFDGMGMAD